MHSSLVALGSELGRLRLVETATAGLAVVFRARLGPGPIAAVAFSPDAKILSVATGNRWDQSADMCWFMGCRLWGSCLLGHHRHWQGPSDELQLAWQLGDQCSSCQDVVQ